MTAHCSDLSYLGQSIILFFGDRTLVVSQYWMTKMFKKEIIGLVTGLVLGIGYAGSGFGLLILGSGILPLLDRYNISTDRAWRLALIVPTSLAILTSVWLWMFTDDSPKEYYSKLSQERAEDRRRNNDSDNENCGSSNTNIMDSRDDHNSTSNKNQQYAQEAFKIRWERFRQAATNVNTWILFLQYGVAINGSLEQLGVCNK